MTDTERSREALTWMPSARTCVSVWKTRPQRPEAKVRPRKKPGTMPGRWQRVWKSSSPATITFPTETACRRRQASAKRKKPSWSAITLRWIRKSLFSPFRWRASLPSFPTIPFRTWRSPLKERSPTDKQTYIITGITGTPCGQRSLLPPVLKTEIP